jgi:hypothetical protein
MSRRVTVSVRIVAILTVTAAAGATGATAAQGLAQRVAAVGVGSVSFSYTARAGVEICDRGVSLGDRRVMWRGRSRDDARCVSGPVTVTLRIDQGLVRDVDVLDLDDVVDTGTADIGTVGAREAVDYFVAVARGAAAPDVAEDAVFAAVLADVEDVSRDLLEIARGPFPPATRPQKRSLLARPGSRRSGHGGNR